MESGVSNLRLRRHSPEQGISDRLCVWSSRFGWSIHPVVTDHYALLADRRSAHNVVVAFSIIVGSLTLERVVIRMGYGRPCSNGDVGWRPALSVGRPGRPLQRQPVELTRAGVRTGLPLIEREGRSQISDNVIARRRRRSLMLQLV